MGESSPGGDFLAMSDTLTMTVIEAAFPSQWVLLVDLSSGHEAEGK
jgi:hypothetical protein